MSDKQNQAPRHKRLIAIGIATLAVVAVTAFVLIAKPSITFNSDAKPVVEMSDEERAAYAEKIKAQIGKHLLMTDEMPEIMVAEDSYSELVAQGGFWKNLERGDLILVFTQDPRVIIWRPSEKLIVNVGPIINTDGDGYEAS